MSLPNIIRQFQNQERDGSFFLLFAHWRFRVCRKNATQSGWPQHPHIGGCAILPGTKRVSNHVLVLNPFLQALVFQKHATGLSMIPLLDQRMLTVYCSLLSALYQHQQGALGHGLSFSMRRGVKQTDVISSCFWSCSLFWPWFNMVNL